MSSAQLSTVSILNEAQKDAIVHYHLNGGKTVSQTWIAKHFGVHRKTVYTVLKERGVLLTKEERIAMADLAKVMKELNLTPQKVRQLAEAPALTPTTIIKQLMQLDAAQLTRLFYDVIGAHHMQEAMAQEVLQDAA